MALEGSLKEFGLADILQLLYYQRKTGVLMLESRLDTVRLLFHEGKIVSAESKKRTENRLGKILIKKGLLSEQNLMSAMKEQKTSRAKLGHILVKKNLVTKEQVQEILMSQITETTTQVLAWKEGRYEFKPQGVPLDKEIPLSVDTQHLLMDGLRIIDEWSQIEGRINMESCFEKTEKTATELTEDEQEILRFVDGKNDVSTIADLSGIDTLQASTTILSLLDRDLISLKKVQVVEKPLPRPAVARAPLIGVIIVISILLGLIVSLITVPLLLPDTRGLIASERVDALRFSIETYRHDKGGYPVTLTEITDERDPWGGQYIYSLMENGFVLSSPGPDRTVGTKDDIY